ncbi:MAG: hypothetical protein JXA03_07930 [Bacteroidales bacterium]|nr:hypothetical protein [Bacteroidales bacterium]
MVRYLIIIVFLAGYECIGQQQGYTGIHMDESKYHSGLKLLTPGEFDSLNQFTGKDPSFVQTGYELTKTVFGYYPYWAGSNYLNYHWDLLSDLCFFSYEVDPYTGFPVTVYGWETAPVIDSALQNNVNVHLCVTLFNSHGIFFSSPVAQQNLINTLISLLQTRGAKGVNIDFEAMSAAYKDDFTSFIANLSGALHNAIPGSKLSIASPAVDWVGAFDIPELNNVLDFFMIMSYDYYWNGSSQAGPVSGLYSMAGNFDYSLSRTISWYESKGVETNRMVAGIPYYGRQWPTQSPEAPSAVTGSGTAYTYRHIRDNPIGYYTPQNKKWEPNSFSPYYSFNTTGWNQCFTEDTFSLGKKYDLINRRNLAGIGIWALGYDNGYEDLWNLLASRFSAESISVSGDSLFDSGGPAFNYYDKEYYNYTIKVPEGNSILLEFQAFELETGYDSLWVYDGPGAGFPLLGEFSGAALPGNILSTGNELTLNFYSDGNVTYSGWKATYTSLPVTSTPANFTKTNDSFHCFPNPSSGDLFLTVRLEPAAEIDLIIITSTGREYSLLNVVMPEGESTFRLLPSVKFPGTEGIYFLKILKNNVLTDVRKFILISD